MILNEYQLNADLGYQQTLIYDRTFGFVTWANASFEVPKVRSGFGLSYRNIQDEQGMYQDNQARFNYAFRFHIKKHTIVPAIYVGLVSHTRHSTMYGSIHGETIDVGLGLNYRFKDLLFGISMSRLNTPVIEGVYASPIIFNPRLNLILRYDWKIGKMFRIMPLTIFTWSDGFIQIDDFIVLGVDSISKVLERVNLGIGYSLHASESQQGPSPVTIVLAPEFIFKWFRIGYTLDWEISTKTGFSVMRSHQITLRMHLFRTDS